jgi:spermidine/putrescine transport system substrate-binding protein
MMPDPLYGSAGLAAKLSRRAVLRLATGAAAGLAAPATPRGAGAQERKATLALLTWEPYAPPFLVDRFEKDTGIKVTVTRCASNAELIAKLRGEGLAAYDLVQPTVAMIPAGLDERLYQPLEAGRVRNLKHVLPALLYASDDLGGVVNDTRYGLPFAWGAEGLSYNTKRLTRRPDSFGALHDPDLKGRISYRATFHVFVSTGLWLGLGRRMRDVYESPAAAIPVLDRILERLQTERELVRTYWSTATQIEELLGAAAVDVAQTWDGTAWRLAQQGKPVRFVAPREGALAWLDGFALPRGTKKLDEAYAWIDFMYEPRNAAAFASDARLGPVVDGTGPFLEPAFRELIAASFSKGDVENLWWYRAEPAWWPGLFARYVARLRTGRPGDDYDIEQRRAERAGPPEAGEVPAPAGGRVPVAPAPPPAAPPPGPSGAGR